VQGGFIVQATGEKECTVIHYEQYFFAPWFVPLRPLIVAYLNWSVRKELRKIQLAALNGKPGGVYT